MLILNDYFSQVLRGDSAEMAAMHPAVRGIVVSNHGGRQLDNCIAPLTALPEIVRVVDRVNIDRKERGLEPVEVRYNYHITEYFAIIFFHFIFSNMIIFNDFILDDY
jgi:hypothetical protein